MADNGDANIVVEEDTGDSEKKPIVKAKREYGSVSDHEQKAKVGRVFTRGCKTRVATSYADCY